jgi:hypothetical protein
MPAARRPGVEQSPHATLTGYGNLINATFMQAKARVEARLRVHCLVSEAVCQEEYEPDHMRDRATFRSEPDRHSGPSRRPAQWVQLHIWAREPALSRTIGGLELRADLPAGTRVKLTVVAARATRIVARPPLSCGGES